MNNTFYRAFEERYRGSRQLIMERLRVYSTFVVPLVTLHQPARALDLGCGRGEWLELLGEAGFDARGVDLDDNMLAACRERGLNATRADALATLHGLPDASVALVSAFHLVEHIPFDDVQTLIAESLRVLQPGGLLIMETPNPENLVVGTSDFYNDPSHLHPIPPKLLVFATEHAGFSRHTVLRLQEAPTLATAKVISLYDVIGGASPDFSVVSQKAASPGEMTSFDAAFESVHGIDVYTLAQRFDILRDEQIHETRAQLAQLADRFNHQSASASHEAAQALLGLGQLQQSHQALAQQVQLAAQQSSKIDQYLSAVNSTLAALRVELDTRAADLQKQLAEHGEGIQRQHAAQDAALHKQFEYVESRLNLERAQSNEALATHALEAQMLRARLEARLTVNEEHLQALRPHLPALLGQETRIDALMHRLEQRLAAEESNTAQLQMRIEQAESATRHMSERMLDLLASRSWRVTAPLRVLGSGAVRLRVAMRRRDDADVQPRRSLPYRLAGAALRRLRFRHAGALVRRFPWLYANLYKLMSQDRAVAAEPAAPSDDPAPSAAPAEQQPPGGDLSPRALHVYNRLIRLHRNEMN